MFRITREWIEDHRTARGAWTCNQIIALGLKWPPRRGWKDRAIGRKITETAQTAFERDGGRLLDRDESVEAQTVRAHKAQRKGRYAAFENVEELNRLCDFWRDIAHDSTAFGKMKTIRRYATTVIPFAPGYSMERNRADYNAYYRGLKHGTHCFVCNGAAVEQHHVILLKHGGTNDGRNRIPICRRCHEHIHDWMKPEATIKALDDEMAFEDQHWREMVRVG